MWLIRAALRRPITVIVIVVALALSSILALLRTRIDIFPDLNLPVIYVAQPYGGMSPQQMEGFLSYYYEYHFLYINGIESVEAKSIQGIALLRLTFPSRDGHERGAGADDFLREPRSRLHAARHSFSICVPLRRRHAARRLSRFFKRIAHAWRNSGPCVKPRAACFCDAAGSFVAAAFWRQPTHDRRQR